MRARARSTSLSGREVPFARLPNNQSWRTLPFLLAHSHKPLTHSSRISIVPREIPEQKIEANKTQTHCRCKVMALRQLEFGLAPSEFPTCQCKPLFSKPDDKLRREARR